MFTWAVLAPPDWARTDWIPDRDRELTSLRQSLERTPVERDDPKLANWFQKNAEGAYDAWKLAPKDPNRLFRATVTLYTSHGTSKPLGPRLAISPLVSPLREAWEALPFHRSREMSRAHFILRSLNGSQRTPIEMIRALAANSGPDYIMDIAYVDGVYPSAEKLSDLKKAVTLVERLQSLYPERPNLQFRNAEANFHVWARGGAGSYRKEAFAVLDRIGERYKDGTSTERLRKTRVFFGALRPDDRTAKLPE